MAWRNGWKLVIPDDAAYRTLVQARTLISAFTGWLDTGSFPALPRVADPFYTIMALPGAYISSPGDFISPAVWMLLLGLALAWWMMGTARILAREIIGGWAGAGMLFALGVSAPVMLAFFSCGGAGLGIALGSAMWMAWIVSDQDKKRSWWISPAVFSLATGLSVPGGWAPALACTLTAAFFFNRQSGYLHKRVWPSVAIGVIPAITIATIRILHGPVGPPDTGFNAGFTSFLALIPPVMWHGTWPGFPFMVMIPGAGLLFLLGLVQPGAGRAWNVMGGMMVLAGGLSGNGSPAPGFLPFIVVSFSGAMRLSEIVPEAWRKIVLKTIVWGWIICAIAGLLAGLDRYGRKSAAMLGGPVSMTAEIPSEYSGGVIAEYPGMAGWFSGRTVGQIPPGKGLFPPRDSMIDWPLLNEIEKMLPPGSQDRIVMSSLIPSQREIATPFSIIAAFPSQPGYPGCYLVRVDWGKPAPLSTLPGWKISDSLDCVLPVSEMSHKYRMRTWGSLSRPEAVVSAMENVGVDSGWILDGTEEYSLKTVAGRPIVLMARIMSECRLVLGVEWNGKYIGRIPVAPRAGVWQDILLMQSDGKDVGPVNRARITDLTPHECQYTSFHYWVMQPEK